MAAPLVLAILFLVIYPLFKLVYDSLTQGDGPGNYVEAFKSSAIRKAILMTLAQSAAVTVLSVTLGSSLAWTLRRATRRSVTAVLWAAVLLPFWMGLVVKNYAFALLLAREGAVNHFLQKLGLIDQPVQLLYTAFAVVLGMTYTMIPYAVLAAYPTMTMVDVELLNAAQGMGASKRKTFSTVLMPLIRPGIVASTAIVFAISIGFYVTPVLLGGAQTPFIATVISDDIFTFFNYPRAAASSVILLVIAISVLGLAMKAVGLKAIRGGLG
ncbi:ABC transporter permease [Planosporangium flavigriseum]|uniref:ABC transporter permease n=1 Tax=Planosporangium flavigriseum TaxID=373681 RepID=A0A8J3LWI3_9ACTN|nr:ABC transporter permease [Planosporangium flavigriseum]NJC66066.1 ABC transporter permease [Planosporangium flavigriseum]GIG75099.1 ABC transporter permease [Planosporangium flavigriseum]